MVLPAGGTVSLADIRLVQYAEGEVPGEAAAAGAWWGDRTAGLIGGIVGSVVGLMGGAIGLLCSLGRGRAAAGVLIHGMLAVGVVGLAVGAAALALRQPYAVWYPMLLTGVIATVLPLTMRTRIRARFEEMELRRMQAMDAGRA
jgi:hypothetical protein